MIVKTGKYIEVSVSNRWVLSCSAELPGVVTVTDDVGTVRMSANPEEAERLIAAYRRVVNEDVSYQTSEVE